MNSKPFPIPVVSDLGPMGMHAEDEGLDYMPMPKGMNTYAAPILPEPEEMGTAVSALAALHHTLDQLHLAIEGHTPSPVSVLGFPAQDVKLLNQILGEGEVAATVLSADEGLEISIQESVFAGVWRVLVKQNQVLTQDYVEVGAVPTCLIDAAKADWLIPGAMAVEEETPHAIMNIPSLLTEIRDQTRKAQAHLVNHTINLTLLPVTVQDISYLDYRLGTGRITILSRGYGNCRITNCHSFKTWRVVYYNSQDTVILNTVEVTDMPEAASAMPQDLIDSAERMVEVLQWLEQDA